MYNIIYNPLTNKQIKLFSNEGISLLKKYIKILQGGEYTCPCQEDIWHKSKGKLKKGEQCKCHCECESDLCGGELWGPAKCLEDPTLGVWDKRSGIPN